jgi:serine phosphatase RsbU (regulator of sigma subunit)
VAGDFYLLLPGREPNSAIAIVGDVVGHGLAAARRAAFARATLETFVGVVEDPVELLRLANVALQRRAGDDYDFATVICAKIDSQRGEITWARAGHPPPLRLDTAEELSPVGGGPPLGVTDMFDGTARTAAIEPGGGILLYSDGLPEARAVSSRDGTRRPLGEAPVIAEIRRRRGEDVDVIVEGLRDLAVSHAGGFLADDLTMMAIRLRSEP